MRDFSMVSPQFWVGETGRRLRGNPEAQIAALYLITCPSSSMSGLFYLPLTTAAHETGLSPDSFQMALRYLTGGQPGAEADPFCSYDEERGVVWVHAMAEWQLGDHFVPTDNRSKRLKKDVESFRDSPLYERFLDRYREIWPWIDGFLPEPKVRTVVAKAPPEPLSSPLQAPSEGLLSLSLSPSPVEKEKKEKKEKRLTDEQAWGMIRALEPLLATPAILEQMRRWFATRRERRWPLGEKWWADQLQFLGSLGSVEAALASLEHSARNRYQGLFERGGGAPAANGKVRRNDFGVTDGTRAALEGLVDDEGGGGGGDGRKGEGT